MAEILARNGNELTIQVTIKLTGSLMEMEHTILDSCNEIGCLATTEALKKFDTNGSPIKWADTKMTDREKSNKTYQTKWLWVKAAVWTVRMLAALVKGAVLSPLLFSTPYRSQGWHVEITSP